MNEQNKRWFSKHPLLSIILGFILFFAIIGTLAELTGGSEENNVNDVSQEPKVQSEYIGKTLKLNVCQLDSSNADYWQDNEVNFWQDKEKSVVSFKLPACDNLDLEVVEHDEINKQLKVRYNGQEGWISEMQLIK